MARLETHGYKGWWPLRQYLGKDKSGAKQSRPVFRNMVNGEVFRPPEGWDGEPPYPTGDLSHVRGCSEKYAENFEQIAWEKNRESAPETALLTPEAQAARNYRANFDAIRWDR